MLASIPGVAEPAYLRTLRYGVGSQAVLMLAWLSVTLSTLQSGPQLLSPLVAALGALEFWGTWAMTGADPWSLEPPDAVTRARRLRWASGVAAVLGIAGAVAGQTPWQRGAVVLDNLTGFAWVVQVYFVLARFEDIARRLGNHGVANSAGRFKLGLTVCQFLWAVTIATSPLYGTLPLAWGNWLIAFAVLVMLPGAVGSGALGLGAIAVALQLRAALKRAWRQSKALVGSHE